MAVHRPALDVRPARLPLTRTSASGHPVRARGVARRVSAERRLSLPLLVLPLLLVLAGASGLRGLLAAPPGRSAVVAAVLPAPSLPVRAAREQPFDSRAASTGVDVSADSGVQGPKGAPASSGWPVLVPARPMIAAYPPEEPPLLAPVPSRADGAPPPASHVCAGTTQRLTRRQAVAAPPVGRLDARSFGLALAQAARAQVGDVVIYSPQYVRLAYPMGDVAPMFGVCTDVVVRAYRALGIDLQELVFKARVGAGDPSIDHRRVDVLRVFLARNGTSLPVSDVAEDFRPGDIVTYYRPQNRSSTQHIAVVTDLIAPSGRPMIVHNRGWGPQLEDALFVDRMTGHYRFAGMRPAPAAPAPQIVAERAPAETARAPLPGQAAPRRTVLMQPPMPALSLPAEPVSR